MAQYRLVPLVIAVVGCALCLAEAYAAGACREVVCRCPDGEVHDSQAGPNDCVPDRCNVDSRCQAKVEVERLIREGETNLRDVEARMAKTNWSVCESRADRARRACLPVYQPQDAACRQRHSPQECDARLDRECPPAQIACSKELSELNKLNYQRMELERSLGELRALSFACPPAGKCPDIARVHKLYPAKVAEQLCGMNDQGRSNQAVMDCLYDTGTRKFVGPCMFINCTFP